MVETIISWYLQDNQTIPGFLRWCEMDFISIHRMVDVSIIFLAAGSFCGCFFGWVDVSEKKGGDTD